MEEQWQYLKSFVTGCMNYTTDPETKRVVEGIKEFMDRLETETDKG